MDSPPPSTPPGAQKLLASLMGLCLALSCATLYLILERQAQSPEALLEAAKGSAEVQSEALAALVAGAEGVWDAPQDGDVARIMQPDIQGRDFRGVPVSSNRYGLREADFAERKPQGLTRIVLLGDSFVFGYKAEAEDRLGVFLKAFLREQGIQGPVECLHLAVSSWNILSEASYLRRQIDQLQPDLVVHVIISNDLDDTRGTRGFGAIGNFSPQHRERAGGMVSNLTPKGLWPRRIQGYLLYHLDEQSRRRYAGAAHEIKRLADAVESQGGKYLLLSAWETYSPMVAAHLASALRDDQVAYVSTGFTQDLRYRVDATDRHWNRAGHEQIARLIYGLAQERALLPEQELPIWPAAQAAVASIHNSGAQEAAHVAEYEALLFEKAKSQIQASVNFAKLTRLAAKQVHAGVFEGGLVAPFASVILANDGAQTLSLRGTRLAGPALEGARAEVRIEGLPVGWVKLWTPDAEHNFEQQFAIPKEVLGHAFVSITLTSNDYVYADLASGRCASLRLSSLSLQ